MLFEDAHDVVRFGYGKGLSKTPFTKLNIAVFAPIATDGGNRDSQRPGCCEARELRNEGREIRWKGRT